MDDKNCHDREIVTIPAPHRYEIDQMVSYRVSGITFIDRRLKGCSLDKIRLTILTGPGCHLCDEMKETIQKVSTKIPISLETVEITTNRDLLKKYRTEIPVLFYNDREIARHRIDDIDLREKIEQLIRSETEKTG